MRVLVDTHSKKHKYFLFYNGEKKQELMAMSFYTVFAGFWIESFTVPIASLPVRQEAIRVSANL